jgi:hypothetical protein
MAPGRASEILTMLGKAIGQNYRVQAFCQCKRQCGSPVLGDIDAKILLAWPTVAFSSSVHLRNASKRADRSKA